MRNLNITVIGQIGAGKTTFVRTLLPLAPRYVVLDPLDDYTEGAVFQEFDGAAGYFVAHRQDPTMRLVFRGPEPASIGEQQEGELEAFRYMLRLLAHAQRVDALPPLALVLEESTFYADRNNPWPEVRGIYLYGRRWRINTISIAQSDVDISTQVRRNSQAIVALRNVKPSADFARYFGADVAKLGKLEKVTPGVVPVQGKHYLTYPPGLDILAEWKAINTPGGAEPEQPKPKAKEAKNVAGNRGRNRGSRRRADPAAADAATTGEDPV